jgi:peptide/nickel transport system substrate-binding protein
VYRTWMTIVLAALIGIGFAGPRENTLVVGTSQEPTHLGDPLSSLGSQAIRSEVELYLYSGLYRIDLDANLNAELVTEVATTENGRLVITDIEDERQQVEMRLTLRDDIAWSDGTPITTADIELVYEMSQAPGMPLASPDYYARLSFEAQDDKNFTVTLSPAQSSDLVGSPIGLLPAHKMGEAWEEVKQTVAGLNLETDGARIGEIYRGFITDFGSSAAINAGRSAYSGAFVPTRWTPGSALQMTRNPYFHNHPEDQDAYVGAVEYRFITDTNALLFSVVTGAVDATSSVSITFDQALSPQVTARAADRYDIWFVPSATWEHLDVNQFTNVPQVVDLQLNDVRTRKAIVHAIDRQAMSDALFNGLQPVSHSNVSPGDPNYTDDVPRYDYDPETAAALLAELGWTPGADGVLTRTVDGRTVRFELEYVTTAGNAVRERQQQFIAEDLRQVGIDVRINNAPSNVVFANEFINRAYEGAWTGMFMFAWVSSQASSLNAAGYLCRNAPTPDNNWSGQNSGGACSPDYDEVRDRAVAELDPAVAKPLYQEMQSIFARDLIAIPLIFRSNPIVTSNGLVNYVSSTFVNGYGYPPTIPALVGWEQNGATKQFDQAEYARQFE